MTDILITGDLTVMGNVLVQECPIIQSKIVTGEVFINLGVVTFPNDDTIPQRTEGGPIMQCSITPKRADSILEIECSLPMAGVNAAEAFMAVLFRDFDVDALRTVIYTNNPTLNYTTPVNVILKHWVTAGSTSTTTFYIRGGKPSGAVYLTGVGKNQYGGTLTYTLRVTEIMNASGKFIEA